MYRGILVFLGILAIISAYAFKHAAYAQTHINPLISIKKPLSLGFPLNCQIGEDCWVMNYVDMGPDDGKHTDIACLERTYDGHKGTDFAIPDFQAMQEGVNVLAAMDGIVHKTRDSEPDQWADMALLESIKEQRKECGNAILINHGPDLQSVYCHLKQGSVRVKPEQKVKKGDVIAQVGLSGFTEFPHLHFGLVQNGQIIDPFTNKNNNDSCGLTDNALWQKDLVLDYQPFTIYKAGFATNIPSLKKLDIDATSPTTIEKNELSLSFWVLMFGIRQNDKITLVIKDPDGNVFVERKIIQPKNRARQFYFTGRKLKETPLKPGVYQGIVSIERETPQGEKLAQNKFENVLVKP